MAEKKCKHCAMMIPEEAKICPHCRKSQPSKTVRYLVLFIILLFSYTCSQMPPSPSSSSNSTVTTQQEAPLTTQGKKIKAKHPSWSNRICNTVAKKEIYVGMTAEQVKAAWGKPYKINTTIGSYGNHEQWVMSDGIGSDYVYFENGIMTSLQQSK